MTIKIRVVCKMCGKIEDKRPLINFLDEPAAEYFKRLYYAYCSKCLRKILLGLDLY